MKDSLIYDWNAVSAAPRPGPVMLDDETLRDGLQSPSVRTPSIEDKLRILHLIDALGIHTADIGLPGAGPDVARDVERLAREIGTQKLKVAANCAARTHVDDIRPIAEIQQRTGVPIEVRGVHRQLADPAVRRGLDARLAAAHGPKTRSLSRCAKACVSCT